jgi:hypothetical protein
MNEFIIESTPDTNNDDFNLNDNCTITNKFSLDVKKLIYKISKLNQQEKEYILKLLMDKDVPYTKNMNGFFFNMYSSSVTSSTLENINNSIDLMIKNRNILYDIDQKRDLMIKECKELIENKLHNTNKKKQNDYFNKILIKQVNTNIKHNFFKYKKHINYKIYDNIDTIDKKHSVYNKNSVFFRLNTRMKLNTRQHRKSNNQKYLENDRSDVDSTANENIISECIIDDDVICDDDNYDIEEDMEYDPDDYECADENVLIEVYDNVDNVDTVDNIDNVDTVDNIEIDEDNEKLFYKELLNKHGFIFNEDKDCILIYQEYIN